MQLKLHLLDTNVNMIMVVYNVHIMSQNTHLNIVIVMKMVILFLVQIMI